MAMRKQAPLYCDDANSLEDTGQAVIGRKGLLQGVKRLGVVAGAKTCHLPPTEGEDNPMMMSAYAV
jgi:hypothetical protein